MNWQHISGIVWDEWNADTVKPSSKDLPAIAEASGEVPTPGALLFHRSALELGNRTGFGVESCRKFDNHLRLKVAATARRGFAQRQYVLSYRIRCFDQYSNVLPATPASYRQGRNAREYEPVQACKCHRSGRPCGAAGRISHLASTASPRKGVTAVHGLGCRSSGLRMAGCDGAAGGGKSRARRQEGAKRRRRRLCPSRPRRSTTLSRSCCSCSMSSPAGTARLRGYF